MNGRKMDFLKDKKIQESYYQAPNPYVSPPCGNVDLLKLSRYARETGKELKELTTEEIRRFLI